MIQISHAATLFTGTSSDLQTAHKTFARQHCVRIPGFLNPALLKDIQQAIREADFFEKEHSDIAKESCMDHHKILALIHLLLNDEQLFKVIRKITGCEPIGCFTGRLFQMAPGSEHYDSWHDDVTENRMIALSINLSTKIYKGGNLQIRDKKFQKIFYDAANTGFGDAILFRVAPFLEHQVGKVTGRVTRTTYAGWFRSEPRFIDSLKHKKLVHAG